MPQMRKKIAVLISGSGSNLQALIDACISPDYPAEIALVLSNKADAYGLTRAMNAGIPTEVLPHKPYPTREAFDAAMQEILLRYKVDYVCLAGFMRLLTAGFVSQWYGRMINIHPSLLPLFKGLHTHQQAIDSGMRFAGCTVHFVVPEMDSGPIILQGIVPIHGDDTAERLNERVLKVEHKLYPLALKLLASGRLSQENGKVVIAGNGQWEKNCLINPVG